MSWSHKLQKPWKHFQLLPWWAVFFFSAVVWVLTTFTFVQMACAHVLSRAVLCSRESEIGQSYNNNTHTEEGREFRLLYKREVTGFCGS